MANPLLNAIASTVMRKAIASGGSQLMTHGAAAYGAYKGAKRLYDKYPEARGLPWRALKRQRGGELPPTPPMQSRRVTRSMDTGRASSSTNNNTTGTQTGNSGMVYNRYQSSLVNRRRRRRNLGGRRPMRLNGNRRRISQSGRRAYTRRSMRRVKRKVRKGFKLPEKHITGGIANVSQNAGVIGGTTDDSRRTIYIGHTTTPAVNTMYVVFLALCKKILTKAGFDVRGCQDGLPVMTFTFGYYTNPRRTAVDTFTSVNPANLQVAAQQLLTGFWPAVDANPAMAPHEMRLDFGGNIYYLHTDTIDMKMDIMSLLKIQNRTPNDDGGASVDTNNINFITGRKYIGGGTGAYYKDVRTAAVANTYVPFIGTKNQGLIKVTVVPNSSISLQTPPPAKCFTYVQKAVPIQKFVPGATIQSTLKFSTNCKFSYFIDQFLKEVSTQDYVMSRFGKFAFFAFTKYIDDDTNKPVFSYEIENHIGITIGNDKHPVTVQNYDLPGPP